MNNITNSGMRRKKYNSIHICRAIAALLVTCFHLGGNLAKEKYYGAFANRIEHFWSFGGVAGVAFFFVLSGFIITQVHADDIDRPSRLLDYLRKRVVRIYPIYIVVFIAVYTLAWTTPSLRESLPTDVGILFKSLLLLPQDPSVVGGTGAPVVLVAWTLQYEMVFYAVMGFAIFSKKLLILIGALFILNIMLVSAGCNNIFPYTFFANHLILLFGLGSITALIARKNFKIPLPGFCSVFSVILFMVIASIEVSYSKYINQIWFDFGYGISAALLILSLLQEEDAHPDRYRYPFINMIGDASYSLYLIHFPIISVLSKFVLTIGLQGAVGVYLSFFGILSTCVGVSILLHIVLERPLLSRLSTRSR